MRIEVEYYRQYTDEIMSEVIRAALEAAERIVREKLEAFEDEIEDALGVVRVQINNDFTGMNVSVENASAELSKRVSDYINQL